MRQRPVQVVKLGDRGVSCRGRPSAGCAAVCFVPLPRLLTLLRISTRKDDARARVRENGTGAATRPQYDQHRPSWVVYAAVVDLLTAEIDLSDKCMQKASACLGATGNSQKTALQRSRHSWSSVHGLS